jgi:hypothetical protein
MVGPSDTILDPWILVEYGKRWTEGGREDRKLFGGELLLLYAIRHGVWTMGVWQGVATDCIKYHPSLPFSALLRSAGGPPLKWVPK